jgi:asparagine synthase (glutamine-hydrolysing)
MVSSSGRYVVVFNGEIYNYRALREELHRCGVEFKTESDTEVILEAYGKWGNKVFQRFDGMFAMAIYDNVTAEMVLARDRIGEKPLYVAKSERLVAFSSELKPLLSVPGLSNDVSEAGLYEYLALRYVTAPHTIFEAITSVQPGTYQIFRQDGTWSEYSYYAYDLPSDRPPVVEAEYLDALEEALTAAVRTRLVADVPVGAFLSSGVDSSLVCGIAALGLGSDIRCFCAGFAGSSDNETDTARLIAETYGLPFEEYQVSEQDILHTASDFGAVIDEPNGDRSCVPTYLLSRLVSGRVTVAVSGDGGDELFGGYGRYAALRYQLGDEGTPLDAVSAYFAKGLPVFNPEALDKAFPGQWRKFRQRVASRFTSAFARNELDNIERMRLIDMHSYLPGAVLAKVDRMSMRHSLEVRTPFFSPDILRLSMRLPMSLCADGQLLKLALRKLLARYLPEDLIRPVKQGFGMPASFFKTHAKAFSRLASEADEALAEWPVLQDRPEAFDILRQASRENINSYWAWIVLGQWTRRLPAAWGA